MAVPIDHGSHDNCSCILRRIKPFSIVHMIGISMREGHLVILKRICLLQLS